MTTPLPGWYQDPAQPNQQKWWDGAAWTNYTLPLAEQTQAEPAEQSAGSSIPDSTGTDVDDVHGHVPLATQSIPDLTGREGGSVPGPGNAQGYPGYQQGQHGAQGYAQQYPGSAPAYPAYPGYPGFPGNQMLRSNPLALTGFILGLVSILLFFIPIFGTAVCLAAVVFSAVGLAKQRGRASRYKAFGIIGLVLGILFSLLSLALTIAIFSSPYYY